MGPNDKMHLILAWNTDKLPVSLGFEAKPLKGYQ